MSAFGTKQPSSYLSLGFTRNGSYRPVTVMLILTYLCELFTLFHKVTEDFTVSV